MTWTTEQRQTWWAKQPPGAYRKYKLKHRHGITLEEYARMLAAQNGHCYFCARTPDQEPGKVLCIDHDHATGRLRGLLCKVHNRALANFGDDAAGLQRAWEYARGPRS